MDTLTNTKVEVSQTDVNFILVIPSLVLLQVKKTWGATLTTLQDMTVLDDYDVSQSFTHSPSSESVKSSVSDGYLNKPSLAKRRANQQETELFYFTVRLQLNFPFSSLTLTSQTLPYMLFGETCGFPSRSFYYSSKMGQLSLQLRLRRRLSHVNKFGQRRCIYNSQRL